MKRRRPKILWSAFCRSEGLRLAGAARKARDHRAQVQYIMNLASSGKAQCQRRNRRKREKRDALCVLKSKVNPKGYARTLSALGLPTCSMTLVLMTVTRVMFATLIHTQIRLVYARDDQ